jgi:hypothetical protein
MNKSSNIRTVNLEAGFPDRKEACARVQTALIKAKQDRGRVIKFIHGYGSSGLGGSLKFAVRGFLRQRKEQGEILCFVNGESLSSFDPLSSALVRHAPELLLDADWGAANKGITLALVAD